MKRESKMPLAAPYLFVLSGLFFLPAQAAVTGENGFNPPPDPHEWPLLGVDNIDPCNGGDGVQMVSIGPGVIWYRTGDNYWPVVNTDTSTNNLLRFTSVQGVAGNYRAMALLAHENVCEHPSYDNVSTARKTASGGTTWEAYFCDTINCQCAPTELEWKIASIGRVISEVHLNFNNCWSTTGGASAYVAGEVTFTGGHSAKFTANPSGDEGSSALQLGFTLLSGDAQGSLSTTIDLDSATSTMGAAVTELGKWKRGCEFVGKHHDAHSTVSVDVSLLNGAAYANADIYSHVDPASGVKVKPLAGQDGCRDPLGSAARFADGRVLRDGTPITEFLSHLAALNMPQDLKVEILYDVNAQGPEIDFYLILLDPKDVDDFFDIVNCDNGIYSCSEFNIPCPCNREP
jgi:hypothetical protein